MKKIMFVIMLFLLLISCSSEDETANNKLCGNGICDATEEKKGTCSEDCPSEGLDASHNEKQESKLIYIVFSGTYLNGGNCQKADLTGCDIYYATYDFANREVISVDSLSSQEGIVEHFAEQDPTGKYILYSRQDGSKLSIEYILLNTLETGTLLHDAWDPRISLDGTLFGYSFKDSYGKSSYTAKISFDGKTITLDNKERIPVEGEATEPVIFPDNTHIGLYKKGEEKLGGHTLIYDITSGDFFEFSNNADGCSHGTVNYKGTEYICDIFSKPQGRTYDPTTDSWSSLTQYKLPKEIPDYFKAMGCDRLAFGHSEFCGDNNHLLTTVDCVKGGETQSAHLALITLDGTFDTIFHEQVEAYFNVENTQSRSGVCTLAE